MKKNNGRACCLFRPFPRTLCVGERVSRANNVSSTSCPNAPHSLSAICHEYLTAYQIGKTYLESVEDDIELDCILPSDSMVHLARIRRSKQYPSRYDEQQQPQHRMQMTRRYCLIGISRVDELEEIAVKGKDGSNGEDGKVVQESVEA